MAKVQKKIENPVELVDDEAPAGPITIEIEDPVEAPSEIEVASPAPKTAAADDDDAVKQALEATKRADELQRSLAEANRRADEQARIAREREDELSRERGDRADAEYNSILTAIAAEQASLEQAELAYQQAASAGDWATAAKAQRAMATASARVDRLEDNKAAFDSKRESDKKRPAEPQPAPRSNDFETQISNLPHEAKTWLRAHPEYWTDPAKNRRVQALHSYLVEHKGLSQFSREYFDEMDNQLGIKAPAPEPQHTATRRSMPVSAPVSRDVPGPTGVRTTSRITLTPEEVAIARSSFSAPDMTNEQKERLYAMNKAKLARMRANGSYRATTEQNG